ENAGVLQSDNASAHHRQSAGQLLQAQDVVAAEHALAIERNVVLASHLGAGGNHHPRTVDIARTARAALVGVCQTHRVRIDERRLGGEHFDAVAHQLVSSHVDFVTNDVLGAEQKVLHGDVLLDRVGGSVKTAESIAG